MHRVRGAGTPNPLRGIDLVGAPGFFLLFLGLTTAWALAVRNSGRTPLYSTSWRLPASLA